MSLIIVYIVEWACYDCLGYYFKSSIISELCESGLVTVIHSPELHKNNHYKIPYFFDYFSPSFCIVFALDSFCREHRDHCYLFALQLYLHSHTNAHKLKVTIAEKSPMDSCGTQNWWTCSWGWSVCLFGWVSWRAFVHVVNENEASLQKEQLSSLFAIRSWIAFISRAG